LQNVVFWMVKRGDVVVFCVAGSACFSSDKNAPRFRDLFLGWCWIRRL